MNYRIKEEDCYLECYSCDKKIDLGDEFRYTPSGNIPYCQNFECVGDNATLQGHLEYCWFGENEDIIWKDGIIK